MARPALGTSYTSVPLTESRSFTLPSVTDGERLDEGARLLLRAERDGRREGAALLEARAQLGGIRAGAMLPPGAAVRVPTPLHSQTPPERPSQTWSLRTKKGSAGVRRWVRRATWDRLSPLPRTLNSNDTHQSNAAFSQALVSIGTGKGGGWA